MKVLAIETSTMAGSAALIEERKLVAEYVLNIEVTHSERLFVAIDCVMRDSNIPIGEVDGFALSLGPGSFTGLRIGASTIKGLAFAAKKPVVGIPTLDAMAENLVFTDKLICPMLDARKKEVYTALYRRDSQNRLEKLIPDLATDPKSFLKEIDEEVVFFGNGARVYQRLIREELQDLAFFAPFNLEIPRAANVAMLSLDKFEKKNTLDLNTFVPIYIRASEAEMIARQKRGLVEDLS